MATSTEPILIQIIDETSANVKTAVGGKSGGKDGGMGGAMGGIAKLGAVAGVVMEIAKMVGEALDLILKPVKSILTGIFKLVAQLLRPVVDIIIILLQPILIFLKPIIKVFNDIMRPFRAAAYQLLKASNEAGPSSMLGSLLKALAIQAILTGFGVALMAIIGEMLKMAYNTLIELIKMLILNPLFDILVVIFPFVEGHLRDIQKNIYKTLSDSTSVFNNIIDSMIITMQKIALGSIMISTQTIIDAFDDMNPKTKERLDDLVMNLKGFITDLDTIDVTTQMEKSKKTFQGAIDDFFKVKIKGNSTSLDPTQFTAPGRTPSGNVTGPHYTTTDLKINSDVNLKTNFQELDSCEILNKISKIPITMWNYKYDIETRHIGPMAQDFYREFEVGSSDKTIHLLDEAGVAFIAIQELNKQIIELKAQVSKLSRGN